jgi:hypothetical protein
MSEKNITKEIKQLYLEDQVQKIAKEVKEELKNGAPQDLKDELSLLLEKCKSPKGEIIEFPTKVATAYQSLATVELLAAGGKSVGDLVTQPLVCKREGFSVDIRRVLGSNNEVTLYFQPVDDGEHEMEEVFSPYKGKTITLDFIVNGAQLLNASIYVDESARQAEGTGVLFSAEVNLKDPKIQINVSTEK